MIFPDIVLAGKDCSDITYCVEGEKCDGDRCLSCELGYVFILVFDAALMMEGCVFLP